jgi:hypothetical protein
MPNQLSPLVEGRIIAFALGHPRSRSEEPPRCAGSAGAASSSPTNGVWRCLRRQGAQHSPTATLPRRRLRRPLRAPPDPSPSATSRPSVRASSWPWTPSTSAACRGRRERSGS